MCKIGFSVNPGERLAAIKGGHPYRLRIAATFGMPSSAVYGIERATHDALSDERMSGEWFGTSPRRAIETINQVLVQQGIVADCYIDEDGPYGAAPVRYPASMATGNAQRQKRYRERKFGRALRMHRALSDVAALLDEANDPEFSEIRAMAIGALA